MIPDEELEFTAIRAQGAGGQNVNKVSSAAQLRFDVRASRALPDEIKDRLLRRRDQRITSEGVIVIKAQQYRSLERNRAAALERLATLIRSVLEPPRVRKPTKPGKAAERRRLEGKARRAAVKKNRAKVPVE